MTDNEHKLRLVWSKRENDLVYHYPRRADGSLLNLAFGGLHEYGNPKKTLINELMHRGYDPTTLKFSIERKKYFEEVTALLEFFKRCKAPPRNPLYNVDEFNFKQLEIVVNNTMNHPLIRQYAQLRIDTLKGIIKWSEFVARAEELKKRIPKANRWY